MRRIILIVGVGASGKTTLQNELIQRGWNRPVNFTTRLPRSDDVDEIDDEGDYISKERDEYVFINKRTFITKLINKDFLEITTPGNRMYGISKHLPEGNISMVVDPVGRAQILEHFSHLGISIETYFMTCTKELQEDRLINRGDTDEMIAEKKRDFQWIGPTSKCTIISGKKDPSELADVIEGRWNEGKI